MSEKKKIENIDLNLEDIIIVFVRNRRNSCRYKPERLRVTGVLKKGGFGQELV